MDTAAAAAALRVREPSERLRSAAHEHEQLLVKIARRRKTLERLELDTRAAATQFASQMAPLVEEARRLDEELHAMLEALVSQRSRPCRERDEILRLYRELQDGGITSPRGYWADLDARGCGHVPPTGGR